MKDSHRATAASVAARVRTSKADAPNVRRVRAVSPQRRSASGAGPTPNAILEAALQIFARDGFDGASIPAIARAASIGHPLVHYHFGSKENLWRAAVDYAFGDLRAGMTAVDVAASDLDPVETLKLLCRHFAGFTARHPQHTLLVLNEVRSGGERFDWLVETYLRPLHARVDRAIDAAVASGRIRPVPAVHLASITIGATAHFFSTAPLVARLYDVDVHDAGVVESHTRWVLDILFDGLTLPATDGTSRGPRP
jgi:AcrR family transcriptional regulator